MGDLERFFRGKTVFWLLLFLSFCVYLANGVKNRYVDGVSVIEMFLCRQLSKPILFYVEIPSIFKVFKALIISITSPDRTKEMKIGLLVKYVSGKYFSNVFKILLILAALSN